MKNTINSHNSVSASSSSNWNIKKMFWWLILWTFLLTSCSDGKKESKSPTEPKIDNIEEVLTEVIQKPVDIQETREYKIYKLWLGSIVPIKWDIQKAKVKITNSNKLSKLLTWKDVEFETIMPSIIKESMMNRDAKSNSWAIGYFQLKPIAVKDVIDTYNLKDLNLDVNDPVDNIILWSLYRKRSMKLLKEWLPSSLSESDLEKMMILSYNVWPARTKTLFKESNATNYQEFQKYLAKKIWIRKDPEKKTDKTYWVDYIDPLTELNIDNLRTKEEKKIAEGLRYAAIIDGISWYIKTNETIQIIWKITCNRGTTLYWEIKKLRDQWVFKKHASINEICKIILESNWYWEKETPEWAELLIIKNSLIEYLP